MSDAEVVLPLLLVSHLVRTWAIDHSRLQGKLGNVISTCVIGCTTKIAVQDWVGGIGWRDTSCWPQMAKQ